MTVKPTTETAKLPAIRCHAKKHTLTPLAGACYDVVLDGNPQDTTSLVRVTLYKNIVLSVHE